MHARRLDEEDVAADRRPGKPGRDAGHRGAHGDLALEPALAEDRHELLDADADQAVLAFSQPDRRVAQDLADLSLKIAHARFARIGVDDLAQRRLRDLDLAVLDAVRLHLALDQIARGDLQLLLLGVAGETDDLHAVAQRPGNRVEHVRRGDEHHARQVERHAEIVVAERVVLLRIEHLEHGRGRIAMDAGAELVDLVQHHHAIARTGLADALDDVARQRADIGAPVAADLRLVVHAAERHAHELAVHGARDRLAERGLADARRSDEAQDRRLARRRELAHGEEFDDAALDLVEAVVIRVEDAARLGDVDRLVLRQLPGKLGQPVEIGADHAVFALRLRHALEPAQFLPGLVLDLLRHAGVGDLLFKLGQLLGLAFLAFAELLLNRRHLLAQQHLALTLVERRLGLLADLGGETKHFDALRHQLGDLLHACGDVDGLEDLLLLLRLDVHVGDGEIGERAGALDRLDRAGELGRRLRQQFERLEREVAQGEEARLDLGGAGRRFRNAQHARDHERPAAEEFEDLEALLALADHVVGAVGAGDVAHDVRHRAHAVHVDGGRIGDVGVALLQNADRALLAHGLLRGGDRLRAADRHRHHHAGEQHEIAHRHDDHRVGRQRRDIVCLVSLLGFASRGAGIVGRRTQIF